MAGTVTVVEEKVGSVKKLKYTWLSDGAGAADGASTGTYNGVLERAVFIPDGGATQPDNLYDVTLVDADGYDVLIGLGANLSNAAAVSKSHADGLGAVANDALTLHVTGAGAANGGVVIAYLR